MRNTFRNKSPKPMREKDALPAVYQDKGRKPYATPYLFCYGDIRDITLGGSPGAGDSGDGGFKLPP